MNVYIINVWGYTEILPVKLPKVPVGLCKFKTMREDDSGPPFPLADPLSACEYSRLSPFRKGRFTGERRVSRTSLPRYNPGGEKRGKMTVFALQANLSSRETEIE